MRRTIFLTSTFAALSLWASFLLDDPIAGVFTALMLTVPLIVGVWALSIAMYPSGS